MLLFESAILESETGYDSLSKAEHLNNIFNTK